MGSNTTTKYKWLLLIILGAALFRFAALTHSPPALNWDEVSLGYNAYSILKTGRDEWGQFLPLSFHAFGENKLPGMVYASIPGIAIFGLTDFGVRITPAIIGLFAVYLVYLLARLLLKQESLALIASALMAISPWAVHFSRVSFEAGLAVVFLLASLIYLIRAETKAHMLWLSMFFAVLSLYTYNSLRIFLPLLLLAYLFNGVIKVGRQNIRSFVMIMATALALSLPIIAELKNPQGRVRLGTVAIQSQKSFVDGIASSRGYTTLPAPLPRVIHNKYTHYLYTFSLNYLKTFSTEFLFLSGSGNTQRSVQGLGMLYLFELPLLVAGLVALAKQRPLVSRLLIPWLLLAPIPSAITIDAPSSVRLFSLLPALVLIESLGAYSLLPYLRARLSLRILAALLIVWNIGYFAYQLFLVYPVKYSDSWLYGYKQAVQFASLHYAEAQRIYLTAKYGEPYIFTLFYTQYDPRQFQEGQVAREVDPTGWVHVKSFDKYIFSDFAGLETPSEIVARNHGTLVMVAPFATLPGDYRRDFAITAPTWEVMFEGTIQEGRQ